MQTQNTHNPHCVDSEIKDDDVGSHLRSAGRLFYDL